MIWQHKMFKPLESITCTGFFVSLISSVVFWLADAMVPGFVSRYFSVHVFLLASGLFGFVWASILQEYASRPMLQVAVAIVCGLVLAVLTWSLAQDLGVYRVPCTIISFFVPTMLYAFIRS